MIRPLKDNVLIAQIKTENTTASGIVLTGGVLDETKKAVVLAIGPSVQCVQVNDVVIPTWGKASVVMVDGNARMVIKEEDIMVVVEQ